MSKFVKQLTHVVMLAFIAVTLSGCGGGDDGSDAATATPLWCKAPNTISEDGTTCEYTPSACNYPEVANDQGLCVMDMNQWIDGSNGITMPTPEYVPQAGEVVLYYALTNGEYDTWGLHAWNNDECNSYSDFERPSGGTDWTAPINPTGIDPNFGAYWVMNIIEEPNCAWFIPHSLDLDAQTADLKAELYTAAQNPTGAFFVLEGSEQYIFPYPRTFESLVVPGGGTLQCEAPLIPNEAGDECIEDPSIPVTFTPGDTELYLRGSMNEWAANDDFKFVYYESVYTVTAHFEPSADAYEFKVADADWSESTSFGAMAEDEVVVIGEGKTLTVIEGQNIQFTTAEGGSFQFTFDATNPEEPVLTVTETLYPRTMYVKGSLNEWSNTTPMMYQGDSIYTIDYALEAGDYEFKVADANWTEDTNFGAAEGDEQLEIDMPKSLVFGEGVAMNIKMTIAEAGNYRFTLDATMLTEPTITVSNAIPYGNTTLYLKGTMNEWGGNLEGYALSYADNHYTLITVLPAGDHEFKIADEAWSDTATLGAMEGEQDVMLGEAKTLTLPGDNLRLSVEADTLVMIDVNAVDKNAPVLNISEYTAFQGRTMYLKGSMNGWSNDDAYIFTVSSPGMYSLTTTLDVASYEFKIADADWQDDSTVGAVTGDDQVMLDTPHTTTLPGDNLKLDITEAKEYTFTLDATKASPVLTVSGG